MQTPKWQNVLIGLSVAGFAVFVLCCVTFTAVFVFAVVSPTFNPVGDLFNRPVEVAGSADLSALDDLVLNDTAAEAAEPETAAQPVADPQASASAQTVSEAPAANQSTGDPNDQQYTGINPPFIPMGGPVDTSNPIPMPPGLPADFPTMSLVAQTQEMSELIGLPLLAVGGEEGIAWAWDGKGVTTATVTCPEWVTCHVNLVDGNAVVLFRGHGVERDEIYAGTFRVESLIPGRGGLCFNRWMAEVYEASIQDIIYFLGEAAQCPNLPSQYEARINPVLGERLREVMQLTGVDGIISIGTVKNGFGAFVIYPGTLGTVETFTCFDGAACAFNNGDGWQWAVGPVELTAVQGVVLYDLGEFANECEAFASAQEALGPISGGTCTP